MPDSQQILEEVRQLKQHREQAKQLSLILEDVINRLPKKNRELFFDEISTFNHSYGSAISGARDSANTLLNSINLDAIGKNPPPETTGPGEEESE